MFDTSAIKIRRANGPWRVRVCFGNPWSFIPWISLIMAAALGPPRRGGSQATITRSAVFGPWRPKVRFWSIFWWPRPTSKKQWFFESSKIYQNCRINRPLGAQGPFLEPKTRLLDSLLASIFRLFPKTAKVCYKMRARLSSHTSDCLENLIPWDALERFGRIFCNRSRRIDANRICNIFSNWFWSIFLNRFCCIFPNRSRRIFSNINEINEIAFTCFAQWVRGLLILSEFVFLRVDFGIMLVVISRSPYHGTYKKRNMIRLIRLECEPTPLLKGIFGGPKWNYIARFGQGVLVDGARFGQGASHFSKWPYHFSKCPYYIWLVASHFSKWPYYIWLVASHFSKWP